MHSLRCISMSGSTHTPPCTHTQQTKKLFINTRERSFIRQVIPSIEEQAIYISFKLDLPWISSKPWILSKSFHNLKIQWTYQITL